MTLSRSLAPSARRSGVAAACVALVLATLLGTPGARGAPAEPPDDEPAASTGERDCRRTGTPLRYLVLFDEGTPKRRATREITRACGTPVVYYPRIGVGVASSADPGFEDALGPDRTFSSQKQRRDGAATSTTQAGHPPRPLLRPTNPRTVGTADRTGEQWDMRLIKADQARRLSPGKRGVLVGVLDSGIDAAHPELRAALDRERSVGCLTGKPDRSRSSWAPTTSVHGTHIAGTIAAADDGRGITGVAPGVRIASVKVIGERGFVDPEAVVCGLVWAADHGMAVTNSSYFVNPAASSCATHERFDVARRAIARAAEYANDRGTLNVAAATNEGLNLTPSRGASDTPDEGCQALPAGLPSVLAVSSVGPDSVKTGYSSFGLGVISVTAPGGEDRRCVLSSVPGGYARLCGTSMAAPHVSGVAALVASAHPRYGPAEVRKALTSTARPLACPADYDLGGDGKQDAYCSGYRAFNGFYGHGLVDALAALGDGATNPVRRTANPARTPSPEKKPAQPPGGCHQPQGGKCDQVERVPDHGLLDHTYREAARKLNSVIQR